MSDITAYFSDWMVSATRMILTQAPDVNGNWVDTLTEGDTIKGVKYNLSTTSNYRNVTWTEEVSDVFVTSSSIVGQHDILRINKVDYHCELPDNSGSQNEVYVIGLRSVS
jgi:hypothetical protein